MWKSLKTNNNNNNNNNLYIHNIINNILLLFCFRHYDGKNFDSSEDHLDLKYEDHCICLKMNLGAWKQALKKNENTFDKPKLKAFPKSWFHPRWIGCFKKSLRLPNQIAWPIFFEMISKFNSRCKNNSKFYVLSLNTLYFPVNRISKPENKKKDHKTLSIRNFSFFFTCL